MSHKVVPGPSTSAWVRVTKNHKVVPGPSGSDFMGHKESQSCTRPQRQRMGVGHKESQSRTRPQRQRFYGCQHITKLHQAPAPACSRGHKESQSRTRPERQNIVLGHKESQSRTRPQRKRFYWSQHITKLHQAPAPACSRGHKESQNRTRPQRRRIVLGHKESQSRNRPQRQRLYGCQHITKSHQAPAPAYSMGSHRVTKLYQAKGTRARAQETDPNRLCDNVVTGMLRLKLFRTKPQDNTCQAHAHKHQHAQQLIKTYGHSDFCSDTMTVACQKRCVPPKRNKRCSTVRVPERICWKSLCGEGHTSISNHFFFH